MCWVITVWVCSIYLENQLVTLTSFSSSSCCFSMLFQRKLSLPTTYTTLYYWKRDRTSDQLSSVLFQRKPPLPTNLYYCKRGRTSRLIDVDPNTVLLFQWVWIGQNLKWRLKTRDQFFFENRNKKGWTNGDSMAPQDVSHRLQSHTHHQTLKCLFFQQDDYKGSGDLWSTNRYSLTTLTDESNDPAIGREKSQNLYKPRVPEWNHLLISL